MKRLCAALALVLLSNEVSADERYPADITPVPNLAYGVVKLRGAYSGAAYTLFRKAATDASPGTAFTASFGTSDRLNNTLLDTFLSGDSFGRVTQIYDQMGANHLLTTVDVAARIGTLNFNGQRTIVFEGNSQVNVQADGTPAQPAMYMSTSVDITPLQINTSKFTMMAVLVPDSSMFVNQFGAPGVQSGVLMEFGKGAPVNGTLTFTAGSNLPTGTLAGAAVGMSISSLGVTPNAPAIPDETIITSISPLTLSKNATASGSFAVRAGNLPLRIMNDANNGIPGWRITNYQAAGSFLTPLTQQPVNPIVLTVTLGPEGMRVYQNQQIRSTSSIIPQTVTADKLLLGGSNITLPTSVLSKMGGYQIGALMVWNQTLSAYHVQVRAAALQKIFGVDSDITGPEVNSVSILGDSISAGYVTLGLFGYANRLIPLLSKKARVMSYGIPGSTITPNPPGGPGAVLVANTMGNWPLICGNTGFQQTKKTRIVIVHGGGNDTGIGVGPTLGTFTVGSPTITAVADTTGYNTGDYIMATGLGANPTVLSKTVNSVTMNSNATAAGSRQFIATRTQPSTVRDGLQTLATSIGACGGTAIIATILPRNDIYMQWINATNALIMAMPAIVAPCHTFGDLGNFNSGANPPGPAYGDTGGHLNANGMNQMAQCLAPFVNQNLN